jgi:hypothetical protein
MARNCRRYHPDAIQPGRPVWRAPSKPPLVIEECPASFVSQQSETLVRDFWLAKMTGEPPLAGGFYRWPAVLADAWFVLAREFSVFSRERRRQERQT